jgi:hypothetical protein
MTERLNALLVLFPMVTIEVTEDVFKRLDQIRRRMTRPLRKDYEGMEIHPAPTDVSIDDVIRELLEGRVTEKAHSRRKK